MSVWDTEWGASPMFDVRAKAVEIARESFEQERGGLQAWQVTRAIYGELDRLRSLRTKGGGGVDLERSGTSRISIRDPGVCVVNLAVQVEGGPDSPSLTVRTVYWPENSNERVLKDFTDVDSTLEYVAGLVGRWLDSDFFSNPMVRAFL